MAFVRAANGIFWGWTVIIMLIATGLLFTVVLKVPQIKNFKDMFHGMKQKSTGKNGVSSFAALCAAVGGQVGTGNLAGVATAIASGGPGAVFWMWLIGIIGMATSFAEAVLAQLFRKKEDDGTYQGGPAFYLDKGLHCKPLAVFFSIVTIIGAGFIIASLQSNSIAAGFVGVVNIPPVIIGIILAILTGLVIFGGIKRLSDIAKFVVPFMAALYLIIALFCVIMNIGQLPSVLALIFKSAFGAKSIAGGAMGFTVKQAFRYGCARGLFSNEAGQGTSPAIHAAADVAHPATQGFVAMFGVFADTLIICTATAFTILFTGAYQSDLTGINLTQSAVSMSIGAIGPYFILICICFFAWTSCLADIYYGEASIRWLFKDNQKILTIYRAIAVALLIVGAMINADDMWELADFFNALMIFPNVIGLVILSPLVVRVHRDFLQQKSKGIETPAWDFNADLSKKN